MQCEVQAESEKSLLEPMCQQRGAAQVAEAYACLEPIKDFLVEWFKHRFLSDWSWQQHFAAAHTPQDTSEDDAGLILQSLAAATKRSSQVLDGVMLAFDPAARRGVNSPVVDPAAAATPIQPMGQEPTTPIKRDT